jgi:hypothetical protein
LPGFVVLTVSDNDRELEQAVETTAKWVCGPEGVGAAVAAVAREFGIGCRTAMTAVGDYRTPWVDDSDRVSGVEA